MGEKGKRGVSRIRTIWPSLHNAPKRSVSSFPRLEHTLEELLLAGFYEPCKACFVALQNLKPSISRGYAKKAKLAEKTLCTP
jgi:hypothetical protein